MIEGLNEILKADSAHATRINCTDAVEEYINREDWRIKANSNTGYSAARTSKQFGWQSNS